MAAGAGRDRDQPVRAFLDRFAGEFIVDHVMQHDAAIGMDRRIHLGPRAERGDDHRHAVFLAKFQVMLQPRRWSGARSD